MCLSRDFRSRSVMLRGVADRFFIGESMALFVHIAVLLFCTIIGCIALVAIGRWVD